MGKPSSQSVSSINHFSHPHPLHLYNHQPYQTLNLAPCFGCKRQLSGSIYSCTTCNYHLHQKCAQMPHQITHPCHKKHHLSLLPTPSYPNGIFNCDACGKEGNGFSYQCKACEVDIHSTCASMPLFLAHPSHIHQLSLIFSPPYPTKSFCCDICKTNGNNHWLYRCNLCGFDAHLTCTMTDSQTSPQPHVMGIPSGTTQGLQNYANPFGVNGFQGAMAARNGQEHAIMLQMFQNMNSTTSSINQALLQGARMGSGVAGSGNPYLNAVLGGAGGSGGGNMNPLLQAFMGGGGGGGNMNPLLQAFMGGGGGVNLLQGLAGGGNGGALDLFGGGAGGGLDFSGLAGGLGGLGGFGF